MLLLLKSDGKGGEHNWDGERREPKFITRADRCPAPSHFLGPLSTSISFEGI